MRDTYSIYDPSIDAHREVSRESALKFIASAKEVEKEIQADLEKIDEEIAQLQAIKEQKGGE